ncbi:MAG: hypothetical protein E7560_04290 [Ruminococcaceae bacterium]|nr:hypothetical protein [Oscillospiraceae bacterium]
MTEKLYDINSHLKEFAAEVVSCQELSQGFGIVLNKTAFFPEGGGQKSDKGHLNDAVVSDVQIKNGEIIHITNEKIEAGTTVIGKIDWERRFDFMQQHSGEHIISGIANKLYGCENVGFHLSEEIVTLDFDKPLSKEQLAKLEALSNKAVFENRKISTYYPQESVLKTLPYRSKKELEGDIRIVEIADVDMCACCAPHVAFTGEIGIIKFLATESLRGGIRIEIKCGGRALSDYNEKYSNVLSISNKLCVKQEETAEAVDKLLEQIDKLKYELSGYKRAAFAQKAENIGKEKITAIFEENLEVKDLQYFSDLLYKTNGGIRAVFSKKDNGFAFAICGDDESLSKIFASFKTEFSVRGGGRGSMVQGTVNASAQEIEEFFARLRA